MSVSLRRRGNWSARAGIVVAAAAAVVASLSGAAAAEDSTAASPMAEACQDGYLCVWDGANGQGARHDFYKCEDVDVRDHGLARVGSFVNNQSDGQVSRFFGPDPANPDGPWIEQYQSVAPAIQDDDQGFDTYGIRVC